VVGYLAFESLKMVEKTYLVEKFELEGYLDLR
jgi:hypothetical protein